MAIVGLAFSVVLVTQMEAAHAAIAASVTLAATVNWLWATRAGARVDERHT